MTISTEIDRRRPTYAATMRCLAALLIFAPPAGAQARDAVSVDQVAADYRARTIADDPTMTYFAGLPPAGNDRFADRTSRALARTDRWKRESLERLASIDPAILPREKRALYSILKERLAADLQLRVCRTELWDVNHFRGWQTKLVPVAQGQPIATVAERREALARWSSLPRFVDTEIANLDRGLALGYAAPKSVVRRVIRQLVALLPSDTAPSPLLSPALRSEDARFKQAFRQVAERRIFPSIRRYRDYLESGYLPKARDGVAISVLPQGRKCYQAMLRWHTGLDRTPDQVYALGQDMVEANLADIRDIGRRKFDTTDVGEVVRRLKADPDNQFASPDALLTFTRRTVAAAKVRAATLVSALPRQDVIVEPERPVDEAAGVSSHYELSGNVGDPATYRVQMGGWKTQTKGEAEIAAVHEAWPGHHLQIALMRERQSKSPLGNLIINSAFVEGWARYAESLAEEAGMYVSDDARVLRRIWPARGMVVDPGLHALGWSRQQAIDYLMSTGRFDAEQAEDMVDRIAVLPGQLTSYDSGALEILTLRRQAREQLGPQFDIRRFNDEVLDLGAVPLGRLRRHIETWIEKQEPLTRRTPP